MKRILHILAVFCILMTSCAEKQEMESLPSLHSIDISEKIEIPNKIVDKSVLHHDNKKSLWAINGELYSGFAVSFYQDSTLKEKIGFLNGRKQNQAIRWSADGHFQEVANYHKGKLHGEKKIWSSQAVLLSHLNYESGKPHGEQKTWYPTGELHKKLNLNRGREKGIQQAFRKNGALYANYEAKEGRIFGLKKSSLCYGLENENVQYEN